MIDADFLLDGPRGRELCLRAAMLAEENARTDVPDDEFREFAPLARVEGWLNFDDGGVVRYALEAPEGELPASCRPEPERTGPDDLFDALTRVLVIPIDPDLLPEMLTDVVSSAKYWQPAERRDRVLAEPRFRDALRPWARMLAAMPATSWWADPVDRSAQLARVVEPPRVPQDEGTIREQQARISATLRREEARDRQELDAAGDRVASGAWWSTPNHVLTTTRPWLGGRVRGMFDADLSAGGPRSALTEAGRIADALGGLLAEDAFWEPWEVAWRPVAIPDGLRVLEIDSAKVWLDLCRRWPLDQTASNWATWHGWTERKGIWVVPDWAEVAQRWDGVHLSLAAYLALAGRTLDVDAGDGGGRATLIAGWSPDETYWFDDGVNAQA